MRVECSGRDGGDEDRDDKCQSALFILTFVTCYFPLHSRPGQAEKSRLVSPPLIVIMSVIITTTGFCFLLSASLFRNISALNGWNDLDNMPRREYQNCLEKSTHKSPGKIKALKRKQTILPPSLPLCLLY